MGKTFPEITEVAAVLKKQLETLENKRSILRSPEMKSLYDEIKNVPEADRAEFGQAINALKQELMEAIEASESGAQHVEAIDVTAPFDVNVAPEKRAHFPMAAQGSIHPLNQETKLLTDIMGRMGFTVELSREIDDEYHMFSSLNFPEGHPARDEYDTFMTDEGLIAPAHTSTMQNRVLQKYRADLEAGKGIRVVIPDRVFRNEDTDARHEHTFYQLEGVYVDKGINAGHLISTLKAMLEAYYQQGLEVKTQPFYFPFTEPSFEFVLSCPFCQKAGCHVCSHTGWIELLGCGMIHPNVLKMAEIDPEVYTGFAWGMGIDRLVMMKYGIEDVRHFHSGNLKFLRQFS